MELYWQSLSDEETIAILAPGVWLKFNQHYDRQFCYTSLYLCGCFGEVKLTNFACCSDEKIIKKREGYCQKYANIIASSFLGQQHPYRDFPKNF